MNFKKTADTSFKEGLSTVVQLSNTNIDWSIYLIFWFIDKKENLDALEYDDICNYFLKKRNLQNPLP